MTAPAVLPIPPDARQSQDSPRDEDAWRQLEQRYQQGTAALNVVKEPVDRPRDLEERDATARREDAALGAPGTAAYARSLYEEKGYLPSLQHPREEERRRVLRRFELHSAQPQGRYPAIDEIAQLAKDVFQVDAVIVNAVLEDRTFFVSSAGWTEEAHAQVEIPTDVSFCPHAMGKSAEAGCFQVPNADAEWRFKRNPLVLGEKPIKFFASANINLPKVEYAPVAKAERLPIGSLCLVHPSPRQPLGDKEEKMLKRMASMVAKEIELAFQVERQRLYDTRLDYVSLLFQQLIVHPSRAMAGRPSTPASLRCVHEGLADKLRTLTESDFAFILDLRGFTGDFAPSPRRTSGSSLGRLDLLDLACHQMAGAARDEGAEEAWTARLCGEEGLRAVQQALLDWHETEQITFSRPVGKEGGDGGRVANALAAFLPDDTSAVITAPLFDHEGVPALCVVVGSQSPHFQYEPSDQRFVRNVGGVLIAGLLQEKILQADQAKLRFVGHVSHELRTPIFAIGSQLELIRDLAEPEAMTTIGPLLDVAETCLTSLREILDDTLDYTKLNNRGGDVSAAFAPVDLDALLVDVVRSCWTKSRRLATIHEEYNPDKLDVVFKSTLPAGLRANVDVGGLKRVLVNLLANSLKFTSNGTITLSAFMDEALPDGKRMFRFECSDTGRGMEPGFMRDHLYTAFKQADPFAPGAGLGTSIADNIVRRMGGTLRYESTLNVGTTATVSVPLEATLPPAGAVQRSVIRNLTDELETLFSPRASVRSSPVVRPQDAEHLPPPPPPPPPLGVSNGTASPSASSVPPSPSKVEDAKRNENLVIGAVDAVAGEAPRSRTKPVAAQSPHLQQVRALVVDDNSVARKVYCTYLCSKGVDFVDAADGEEAVKRFQQHRPNLVWCDIQMPGMDGIEATRRMRECEVSDERPPARIIAVSGLDSTLGEHSTVLSSGQVDKWLVKGGATLRALGTDLVDFAESLSTRSDGSEESIPTTLERLTLGR